MFGKAISRWKTMSDRQFMMMCAGGSLLVFTTAFFMTRPADSKDNGNGMAVNPAEAISQDSAIEAGIKRAQSLAKAKQYSRAFALLKSLIKEYPDVYKLRWKLGALQVATDNMSSAYGTYEQVLKEDPDNGMAHYRLGQLYKIEGKHTQAIRAFNAALNGDPKVYNALAELGNLYLHMKRYERATAYYDALIEIEPENAEGPYGIGVVMMTQKNYGAAAEAFKMAMDLNSKHLRAASNYGAALYQLGRTKEAISILTKCYGLDNTDASIQLNLATAYLESGELGKAQHLLEYGVSGGPRLLRQEAHYRLAQILALSKKPEKALAELKLASKEGFHDYYRVEQDDKMAILRTHSHYKNWLATVLKQDRKLRIREPAVRERLLEESQEVVNP